VSDGSAQDQGANGVSDRTLAPAPERLERGNGYCQRRAAKLGRRAPDLKRLLQNINKAIFTDVHKQRRRWRRVFTDVHKGVARSFSMHVWACSACIAPLKQR